MILLIEDNKKTMEGNVLKFKREGYEVACATTLAEAREFLRENRPEIIIMDIKLPDGDGPEFAKELKQSEKNLPILFLTGLTGSEDIIRGLRAGGDDYLTKPYNFFELLARVGAIARRYGSIPEIINKGSLSIDVASGIAKYDGKDLLLAKKEYALLLIFLHNEERFLTANFLYEKVWGFPMTTDSSALKSAIKRLRVKLEGCGWQISWSRGEGYIFERE
jgi:DNA-binding response OmpR family regulator